MKEYKYLVKVYNIVINNNVYKNCLNMIKFAINLDTYMI